MRGFWDKYSQARVTRRRMLQASGVAAVAAGAIAVAGCGGDDSSPPVVSGSPTPGAPDRPDILNPSSSPQRGGIFRTANSATFGVFDPHLGQEVASAYYPRLYNALLNQSPTKPEFVFLDLAQSYELPDESTYIFTMRPGVKVTPNDLGVPERDLDAEDVRVTLDRLKTDPRTTQYAFASRYIDQVRVQRDVVTVTTPGPYAWFLSRIGLYTNCIPPRELLAGDLSRLSNQAAGAGPYRLVSVSEGEIARFERNPNYYRKDDATGEQLPYLDGLEVSVIFERATQRTAFLSGQIHQYWAASGEEARALGGDYILAREPNFAFISFTMNPVKKPFDDPRVRRAISRAINRQEYIDIVYAGDAQANGLVHAPLGAYALPPDELQRWQPFDLEEARAIVEEVGGIRFKMMYPANTTIEEHGQHLPIFVEQMRAAGIEIDEDPVDFATWVERYHGISYDSSLALNQVYETPELPLSFHLADGPFGDKSYIQGLGDPDIDAAINRANTTADPDALIEAVHEAQRVVYEKDPAFLPLVSPYQHLVFQPSVRNIPTGVGTTSYFLTTYWLDS